MVQQSQRTVEIDLARGVAISLMILSHGVKGLLSFEQIPFWGLVPIHLITKFSSSLFILVFGAALAMIYLPWVGTSRWPERRRKLLIRSLEVFAWYKFLTIIEMSHLYGPEEIFKTLTYQSFPVYSEILGFYAIALLWIPFFLPLWKRMPLPAKLASVPLVAVSAKLLFLHFDFWGIDQLKALIVEHDRFYTWGQLSRAPLVLAGLIIGEQIKCTSGDSRKCRRLAIGLGALAAACALLYLWTSGAGLLSGFERIAKNEGKHPPQAEFMFFSISGALGILSLSFFGGRKLADRLKPMTLIGRESLRSFVFHIFVLFVFYRMLLGFWHEISYLSALILTLVLVLLTAEWVKFLRRWGSS